MSWYTNEVTQNITYATVITIINTVRNTTRYVTSTVDLPDGYTLPPTNEAGTRLCPVNYHGTTTMLPFPSVVADYGSTYSWSGRLPTTAANATGTICSDSGGEAVTFRSHPDFNAFWSSYTTLPPMPPKATGPVYGDPRGLNWDCIRQDAGGPRDDFISSHFTDEAAFSLCLPEDWAPVLTGQTAAYLTTTSVSYEGDGESTTAETAHIETSVPVQVPTPTDVTSTAHTEESAEVTPPTDATSTAHTEESAEVTPPDETSAPGFAHTELPAPVQPPSLSITTVLPTAHTELPQTLDEPEPTTVPPTEVGTVIKPPGTTTAGDGGIGGVIGSLIGSYLSNGGAPPTNIPAQPAQSVVDNPPAGTPAPPSTNIPVGTTSVAVVPTAIPTVISGTSTTIPAVVVGSTTLTAGQTAVIDNTPISVPTAVAPAPQDGQQNNQLPQPPAVVIGGSSTVILPTAPASAAQSPSPPTLTIGDQTIQPSGTAYIISGQTVSPGSPITLGTGPSATIIALTTNAAGSPIVIVGSSTIPYYNTPAITGAPPIVPLSPLTLADGQTIVAASGSAAYVIAGQTLLPGGAPITVAGTTYALTTDAAGQTVAVINGAVIQTVAPAATAAVAAAQTTPAPPLVIYGTTIQPVDGTAYVYDGQTLTLGGTVTVGGSSKTTLVLTTNAAGQTVVVQTVGGTKTTATASTGRGGSSTSSGLGGLINSGLGGGSGGGATAAASSTGAAAVVGVDGGLVGAVLGLLVAVV